MLPAMPTAAIDPAKLRPEDRAERVFARAVWVLMSLALVGYVAWAARNVAYMDDWDLVPVLAGATPFSLSWLLDLGQEHRYILGKALLYSIFKLSGGDFRGAMWVSALILICLAYVFQRVACAVRGRSAFTDAFFPLALLHWGNYESLFFFVQLWFVLPVTLFSTAALIIVTDRWRNRWGVLTLGVCVALLPLNGAMGLLLAPALAAWMVYAAWNSRQTRFTAWALAVASLVAVIFAALYFVHYQGPMRIEKVPRTALAIARTTLEVFGVSFGPGAPALWKYLGGGVAALCAATALGLTVVARRRGDERLRATGLLACLASMGVLALGIGYGRCIIGPGAGSASRYCLLIIPALFLVFLALELYASRFRARLVAMTLFVALSAMFSINVQSGIAYANNRDSVADALLADIAEGVPSNALAQRYFRQVFPDRNLMAQRLDMLRTARVGPYRDVAESALAPAPSCHEQQLSTRVVVSHEVEFGADAAHGLGTDPYVVYALPQPVKVCGIRIHYAVDNNIGMPAATQVFWAFSEQEHFDGSRSLTLPFPAGEQTQTYWVYATIDQFRFDPDVRPCTFRMIDVTFLVED